jgi:hypothetical protein
MFFAIRSSVATPRAKIHRRAQHPAARARDQVRFRRARRKREQFPRSVGSIALFSRKSRAFMRPDSRRFEPGAAYRFSAAIASPGACANGEGRARRSKPPAFAAASWPA